MKIRAQLIGCRDALLKATGHAILILLPLASAGQSPLRLQHISVKEGLSQNSVNFILQDRYGFVWLATGDGLNRYDGKEVIVHKSRYTDSSTTHLLDRNINSRLVEDTRGRIWMAPDAGVSYFDYRHSKFKVVLDRKIGTTVILGVRQNILWAAAPRRGMYAVNIDDLTETRYPFTDAYQTDPTHSYPIYDAAITGNGMWMADAKGLLFFDTKTHKDTRIITRDDIYSACLLRDKRVLATSTDGVFIYDPETAITTSLRVGSLGSRQLWRQCAEDKTTGIVYLGSNTGLIAKLDVSTGQYELLNFQNSAVNSLFVGRSRNLWIGTEGDGAYKLDIKAEKFNTFTPFSQNGVSNGFMVKSIYQDGTGKIWMGTVDKGLWTYDPKTQTQKNIPLPVEVKGRQVGAIIKDSSGQIVVGAAGKIFWLNESGAVKKEVVIPIISASSRELPVLYSITEWKKNHYLAGSNLGIYSVNAEGSNIVARFPLSITNRAWGGWIYGLSQQPDGTIYVGKRSGFSKLRVINDTALQQLEEGLENMVVRQFYKRTGSPILWVASEVGLIAYNEQTRQTQVFDEQTGLNNSNIYAILPQTDSSFWISTNKGIARITVHAQDSRKIKIDAANYTSTDGLQSDEFNTGAYFKNPDGTLVFGGINGINWFHPRDIRHNPYVAFPAISALYINDTLFAADTANYIRSISLPYNKNTISFNLRALEFTQPDENMFAYTLEGLEYDWVYTTGDKARYSNLPPGSYTFLVKARNNEGLWNEEPFRLQVTIRPPYWKTWWFILSAFIAGIGIVVMVVAYFIRQRVKARTLQLEQQQALNMERLRISKDVHDDLGAGLSKIAMMAEMAQKQVVDDMTIGKDIRHISTVSKDLIDNMHDLIWVLNPENTTLDNLVARIREYSVDYLDGLNIEACLKFPDYVPELSITREAQRNIFSTVKEAVSNCIKHSQASLVTIDLSLSHDVFEIKIEDNGQGLVNNKQRQGNGLRNMKQRIEAIGGHFTISSEHKKGTTINISLPMEHLASHQKV